MCEHMTEGHKSHGAYQTVAEINRQFPKQAECQGKCVSCQTIDWQAERAHFFHCQYIIPRFCTAIKIMNDDITAKQLQYTGLAMIT